jgi:Tol biopolymer transport system component
MPLAPGTKFISVSLSPDGTRAAAERVVTGLRSSPGSHVDIWLHDLSRTGSPTRFTIDPSSNQAPVWSPDGARIVFSSDRGGGIRNLYLKASNNASPEKLLLQTVENKTPLDWSPDGRFLLFVSRKGNIGQLNLLPMTGDARKPQPFLPNESEISATRFSPDGRWIAYTSSESGRQEIYVRPFPDATAGKWVVSSGFGVHPRWRRDGNELFYSRGDRLMAVEISSTAGFKSGSPKELFVRPRSSANVYGLPSYDVTADGKKFLDVSDVAPRGDAVESTRPLTLLQNWRPGPKN